jgi:ankyrin repeat protein
MRPLALNRESVKHGYILHFAILQDKFDVTLALLNNPSIDSHVQTSIKANLVHLLLVKYDKQPESAKLILDKCVELGVSLNFVDQMNTAPIHIALRKRQYKALE